MLREDDPPSLIRVDTPQRDSRLTSALAPVSNLRIYHLFNI